MSGPRPPVAKPTAEEFLKLVGSRPVKIYVGGRKEPYVVPVDLISYYSPCFAAAFRPDAFKEGIEGVLRLPEDEPRFFEACIEHMRGYPARLEGAVSDGWSWSLLTCLAFLKFTDKYDISEAARIAAHLLEKALDPSPTEYYHDPMGEILEFAFSHLHRDSPVLTVLINYLARSFDHKHEYCSSAKDFLATQKDDLLGRVMREFIRLNLPKNGDGKHMYVDWTEDCSNPDCFCDFCAAL